MMNNIKPLFAASILLAATTFATASDFFNRPLKIENNGAKNGISAPSDRPSANRLEKNTNAKFMAKQLSKSASANAILGKKSEVLERYGHHSSSNGIFFSKHDSDVISSMDSFAIMSMSRNGRGDVVRVRVESNKTLQIFFNTASGVEVPFEWMNLGENEIFISPSYVLPNGNYQIRLKSKTVEKELKLAVE